MHDYSEKVAELRARIAALRSRIGSNYESFEGIEAQQLVARESREVAEPQKNVGPTPKIEPDWEAINRLKEQNDAREAKEAELSAMKAKLMGKK